MRVNGTLRPLNRPAISAEEMGRLISPLLNRDERRQRIFAADGGVDFAHTLQIDDKRWRFRVNVLQQMGQIGLVARRVNNVIPDFKSLHLPPIAGRPLPSRPGHDPAGRHHRLRQEHHHRLHAGLDQPQLPQAHPHPGRPHRIHLHRRQVPDQPARDRHGREGLRDRHEARGAGRPGRHPAG